MARRETLAEKMAGLKKEIIAIGGVKLKMGSIRAALLEALFSKGDAAVGEALVNHTLDSLDW